MKHTSIKLFKTLIGMAEWDVPVIFNKKIQGTRRKKNP